MTSKSVKKNWVVDKPNHHFSPILTSQAISIPQTIEKLSEQLGLIGLFYCFILKANYCYNFLKCLQFPSFLYTIVLIQKVK